MTKPIVFIWITVFIKSDSSLNFFVAFSSTNFGFKFYIFPFLLYPIFYCRLDDANSLHSNLFRVIMGVWALNRTADAPFLAKVGCYFDMILAE
jgi:hypothetical protein